MHRSTFTPLAFGRALLVGLVLSLAVPGLAPAQPGGQPAALIVPTNGTQRLQMTRKQPISRASNSAEAVLRVSPVYGDPTAVLLTGLEPGIARVTLTDEKGTEERYDIIVQLDVEYLRNVLPRAVPTANVNPIPAANNSIVLTGTVDRATDLDVVLRTTGSLVGGGDRVINALRVGGPQQVQLCVTVAQVSRSEFRRMAFNFLYNERGNWFLGSTVGQAVVNPGLVGAGLLTTGVPGAPNGSPTNAFFGIINNGQSFLGFLQALKDENITKTLAEPRLVAMSGRTASFVSGGEQAIPVPAGLGQVGIQFEEFGTRLNFLPLVLGNGRIMLEVEPEVSNLDPAAGTVIQGTAVPGRNTQRVHTTVEIEPGQTLVIGGLIQKDIRGTTSKFPILGELPWIGAAFSSKAFEEVERKLVVLVTPHLVEGMSHDQMPRLLPGQETRSPDDFELFLEGILEAPRGQRYVKTGPNYKAAYTNGPTASQYPCGGGHGGHGGHGRSAGACVGGACATHGVTSVAMPAMTPTSGHLMASPVAADPVLMPVTAPAAEQMPAGPAMPTTALDVGAPYPTSDRPAALPPLGPKQD